MSHNMLLHSRQGQLELIDSSAIFTYVAMIMLKPGKLLKWVDPLLISLFINASLGKLFWDSHTTETNLSTIALSETKLHGFQAAHGNVTLPLGIRLS